MDITDDDRAMQGALDGYCRSAGGDILLFFAHNRTLIAEKERASIVAWLRGVSAHAWSREATLADAVEVGEHLK